jgi:hypothetical protein
MLSKVALLAAALALSLPVFADKPLQPTQTIAKPPASKTASTIASKSAPTSVAGTEQNSGIIGEVSLMMWKNGKNNNADQKKEAQAAGGRTRKRGKVPGNLTVILPKK